MKPFAALSLLVVVGLSELLAALWVSSRATSLGDFESARSTLSELRRPGDLIVVAPQWAEPLARAAFGDAWMPLEHLARADASTFERAVEVALPGHVAPDVADWPVQGGAASAGLELRVRANPAPVHPVFRFDALEAARVFVESRGRRQDCAWTERAAPSAGGLHGAVAAPSRRFQCRDGAEHYVGTTIIDDEQYRPRRCVWAHPPRRGALVIRFEDVPLGERIDGYAGLSYFQFRDGVEAPVDLEVRVDGASLGRYRHRDERGWASFRFATPGKRGARGDVEFRVESRAARQRHFCFYADAR
jgi:hypothetical protein